MRLFTLYSDFKTDESYIRTYFRKDRVKMKRLLMTLFIGFSTCSLFKHKTDTTDQTINQNNTTQNQNNNDTTTVKQLMLTLNILKI